MHLSDHVLTPNHFLIGQMGGDFVPGSVDSEPFNPRKCWRRLQELTRHGCRAANNGRSTDNVRPDRGLDRSNSGLAGHFDRSFLDTNTLFSIQLSLNAL